MIEMFKIATMGLYPGASIFDMAVLGYSVQITITPIQPPISGGGGWSHDKPIESEYYEITIRVTHNDRAWVQRKVLSKRGLKNFEKVIATLKYVNSIPEKVMFAVQWIKSSIFNNNIVINIKRTNKD
jgi:hypothetical protein